MRWTAPTQLGMQVIRIGTTVALSRLVDPSAFGLIALVTVMTGFFERVLGDTGTTTALVRSEALTQGLASTVLLWNLGIGALTSLVFLAAATPIASLLGSPEAGGLVRLLGLMAVVNATMYVQTALLRRNLQFSRLAIVNLVNVSVTGLGTLALALTGMEARALALGTIAGSAVAAGTAWTLSPWRPSAHFSWSELRTISKFSSRLTMQNLFGYFSFAGDRLVVGRVLGVSELGYYGMANRLLRYPVQTSAQTYREVMFPSLARMQDDHLAMREAYRRTVAGIALVLFPVCFTIAAVAEPLVTTTLGPRWAPASPLVSIIAVVSALQAVATTTGSLYLAKGRADLSLRWTVASSVVLMAFYAAGARWGVTGVAWGFLIGISLLLYPAFRLPLALIDTKPGYVLRYALTPTLFSVAGALVAWSAVQRFSEAGSAPVVALAAGLGASFSVTLSLYLIARPQALRDLIRLTIKQYAHATGRPVGRRGDGPTPSTGPENGAAPAGPISVTIGVLTYRRPAGLRRLLLALPGLRIDESVSVRVVVVDNDETASARTIVAEAEGFLPMPIEYRCEPARSISIARNVAVAAGADSTFVAFIDDDEWPDADWLRHLLASQAATGADIVTGPVHPVFELRPPSWMVDGGFYERRRHGHNERIRYATTSNVLIRSSLLRDMAGPFDPAFGLSGGEDTHLFAQLRERGASLVWCEHAVVSELIPSSRLSTRWLLAREYRRGQTLSLSLRARRGSLVRTVRRVGNGGFHIVVGSMLVLRGVLAGKVQRVRGLKRIVFGCGMLTGLAGARRLEYQQVHGA